MVVVRRKHEAEFREGSEAHERFQQFTRAAIAVPKSESEQQQRKYESKKEAPFGQAQEERE